MIEASPCATQLPARLRPRGVHHLVLNTDNMKRTIDFYTEVMGMPLAHVERVPPGVGTANNRGNPPFEEIRHYFFDMGNDSLLAFFEIPKGARAQVDRDGIGGMQHCAFAVTAVGADGLLARLRAHGVDYLGPIEPLPGLMSAYFFDCNGIRLEMCWRPIDPAGTTNVLAGVRQTRAEALRELAELHDDATWLARVTSAFAE